ncbi:hypothetical protein HYFRA_00008469 [Hymenoscyphus fraxineus]|uniref:Sugar phosphate transporter domain-containing protein n=1 Tax=Hymenoscyphus fraxineus TaxID=746836 RepID=A0A9N9KNA4_9HELO|nr:hypothetical protein HYFRA_00008469 [Hymenoscyphus fraxineus]
MLSLAELRARCTSLPAAVYVLAWIFFSSVTILFNKYILSNRGFPAILTCWHLFFATIATQILARTTTLLDGRREVKMTGRVYFRAIVPIGVLYSASLVCSNQVYLYLSVAFIQMLKASSPFAVLIVSYSFGVSNPKLKVVLNILVIVFGVALASFGEIKFSWIGFFYQGGGIFFEAIRLVMIQILLSGEGQNMDPLVSLYYYAPICTAMNLLVAMVMEFGTFQISDIYEVGLWTLLLNAAVAFLLNVSSVFLIGKTSGLVMTLCGVLKNILLVVASILIWATVITPIQFFGYSIALCGLVYYGAGYDGIMTYYNTTKEFAQKILSGSSAQDPEEGEGLTGGRPKGFLESPTTHLVVMIAMYATIFLLLITGIMIKTGTAPEYLQQVFGTVDD